MTTTKLGLTETANGQANYLNVNAALNALDQLVHQRVADKDLATPPGSPTNGVAYIVAGSPTGAWVGHTNHIAYWLTSVGAWSFLVPGSADRWIVRVSDENLDYRWNGSAWAVYSAQIATLTTALNEAPIVTLASASTVNIGAAAANTISISGTTTITAFDSIASGAVRRLVFQGALTLTHNGASLILPNNGSNITTAAGDEAEFVSLGSGNWRCTNYQRADGTTPALGPSSSPTFNTITLAGGQIAFPATQVPSANANTLDDYEEGTWTPVLTFSTPGDLSVTYAAQVGQYRKIGSVVNLIFNVTTSSFTHSTAAGPLQITGAPFAGLSGSTPTGTSQFNGFTKAGYTDFVSRLIAGGSVIDIVASSSGLAPSNVTSANVPSGGTVQVVTNITHFTS